MTITRDRCETWKKKLEDSRRLYQFIRKVYNIKSWLKEKTQVALDESYYEFSNMQVNCRVKFGEWEALNSEWDIFKIFQTV